MSERRETLPHQSQARTGLVRAWPLILLVTLVAAGVGYAATLGRPPVYRATTSLLVGEPFQSPSVSTEDFQASEQLTVAYADVIRRQPVLEGVVDALGLDMSWEQLSRLVQVDVPSTNPQLISVTVEAKSSPLATDIAAEVASQTIALSPTGSDPEAATESDDFVTSRLRSLQGAIARSEDRVGDLEQQLASGTGGRPRRLELRLESQQQLLIDMQQAYAGLQQILTARELPNTVQVLERPGPRATVDQPNSPFVAVLAGGAGFVLALGLAYLLEIREQGEAPRNAVGPLATAESGDHRDLAPDKEERLDPRASARQE